MSMLALFEHAKQAGALRKIPTQQKLDYALSEQNGNAVKWEPALKKALNSLIDQRLRLKKSDPDFIKFGGFAVDLSLASNQLSLPQWTAQLILQNSLIDTVYTQGVALHLRDDGGQITFCATDKKGRTWPLGHFNKFPETQDLGLMINNIHTVSTPLLKHCKPLNASDNIISKQLPDISLFRLQKTPELESLYQQVDSTIMLKQAGKDIGDWERVIFLPIGFASQNMNSCISELLMIPLPSLADRLKYGPTEKTLHRLIEQAINAPEHTSRKAFFEAVCAGLNDKGMPHHLTKFNPDYVEKLFPDVLLERYREDGVDHWLIDRFMYGCDVPVSPAPKPKIEQKTEPKNVNKNTVTGTDTPAPAKQAKPTSQWWATFNEAKATFERCWMSLEPSQLSNELIAAVLPGKTITLTAPERSALEHIATAMQYQPKDVDGGIKWFMKTLEAAQKRQLEMSTMNNENAALSTTRPRSDISTVAPKR